VSADPIIATEALTKSYGRSRGIVDVTMTIESGEVFGFLGPNGAGKTTTIRTLLDFIRPTSGAPPSSAWIRTPMASRFTDASATCPASSPCTST
jgi:ABC-type uncharacterized transport system ATPase subunit